MTNLYLGTQPLLSGEETINDRPLLDEGEFNDEKDSKFSSFLWKKRTLIIIGGLTIAAALGFGVFLLARYFSPRDSPDVVYVSPKKNGLQTQETSSKLNCGSSNGLKGTRTSSVGDLPECEIYAAPSCPSASGEMIPEYSDHLWNTPIKGDPDYHTGFQSMNVLVGYAQLKYNSNRKSCTITVITKTAKTLKLSYQFNGVKQNSNVKSYDSTYSSTVHIRVLADSGETLELEDIDFIWNTAKDLPDRPGDFRNGKKGAIVEMFGWPDDQIELECKTIADAGYLGVKLFPHMEQVMSWQTFENTLNPWYFMYQPVSYSLNGRMGNRSTLRKMIKTCRSYGLRVYADAVVNHMAAGGNDLNYHRNPSASCTYWPPKTSSGEFYNDMVSPYYTPHYTYKFNNYSNRGTDALEFPGVPYGPMDFHCDKPVNSWNDPNILNTGWLVGLADLDTSKDYVRQRIADHFVDLMSIGFTGFRLDAAKHIHPIDLAAIFAKFKKQMGGSYPEDFFTWLEVLPGGEADLLLRDSDYSFTTFFTKQMQDQGLTDDEIDQIKIWWAGYPREPELDEGRLPKSRKVIQNDDHDQQNPGSSSRDLGDNGCVLVKGCSPDDHRYFEKRLFNDPYPGYGVDNDNDYPIRMLLSSYYFTADGTMSPPDGLSDCKLCKTSCESCHTREYTPAYQPDAAGYAGSDYTRVHRDQTIIQAMHEWMHIN